MQLQEAASLRTSRLHPHLILEYDLSLPQALGVSAKEGEARAGVGWPSQREFGEDRRDSLPVGGGQGPPDARDSAIRAGFRRALADLAVEPVGTQTPDVPVNARRSISPSDKSVQGSRHWCPCEV